MCAASGRVRDWFPDWLAVESKGGSRLNQLSCLVVLSFLSHAPEQLTALIAAAKQHDLDFVYAISPGLDMTFSSSREVSTLKRKLDQVGVCSLEHS